MCPEVLNCIHVPKTDKRVSSLDNISWFLCYDREEQGTDTICTCQWNEWRPMIGCYVHCYEPMGSI
jgi:hypothetical protein